MYIYIYILYMIDESFTKEGVGYKNYLNNNS